MNRKSQSILLVTILLLTAARLAPAAETAFFPFCIDWHDAKKRSFTEQAAMLKELGYAGVGHIWLEKLDERIQSLDAAKLKLFQVTMKMNIAPDKPPYDAGFKEALALVKGRRVQFCLLISGGKPSDPAGDDRAVAILREMSDLAKDSGAQLLLYPHVNNWVERIEDAVRVAEKVDRPNVGVMFNLCHWLRADKSRDYRPLLERAMPRLWAVSINGADERDEQPGWKRYIQPLDSGSFDLYGFLKTLSLLGYKGPIGLQCFGIGGDAREHLERSIGAWRKLQERLTALYAVNYEEDKVPAYTLPDPLVCADGTKVTTAKAWREKRRPEILELFRTHVYGRSPARPVAMKCEVTAEDKNALGGKATRREVTIHLLGAKDGPKMELLVYLPNGVKRPVPAFLGLSFGGNHAVANDPGVKLSTAWMRPSKEKGIVENRATEASRGTEASRWQVEMLLARGYALATAYYGDIEPDHAEGWKSALRAAMAKDGAATRFAPDQWGAISAWAWGLSRALDYLETDRDVDAKHVAVIGHSRLGKTALWAGAQDERFALTISNNSGEGGAALARRWFGETTAIINRAFPHWFCGNFKQYAGNEAALPVDQHELVALVAPRPVYVASAVEDRWADPRGEFLAAKHAEPVYRLFGKEGLGVNDMPAVDKPVGKTIGYHIRAGKHDVTAYDWEQYLAFADRHFGYGKRSKK